jgi:hypothetical protein
MAEDKAKTAADIAAYEEKARRRVAVRVEERKRQQWVKARRIFFIVLGINVVLILGFFFTTGMNWEHVYRAVGKVAN